MSGPVFGQQRVCGRCHGSGQVPKDLPPRRVERAEATAQRSKEPGSWPKVTCPMCRGARLVPIRAGS